MKSYADLYIPEKQYGILTEHELRSDKDSLLYRKTFGNPVEVDLRRYYKGELNEGYYKTYPIESVENYIKRLVGDNGKVYIDRETVEHPCISVLTYNDKEMFLKQLEKAFGLCGYYKSSENNYDQYEGLKWYHYEPRYSDDVNKQVREMGYLFHVTPKKHLSKIMNQGLSPR